MREGLALIFRFPDIPLIFRILDERSPRVATDPLRCSASIANC
jgi:hypothetical protein